MSTQSKGPETPSGRYELVNLREWRECSRLSIRALADRSGCALRSVWLTEQCQRKANGETVLRYADALGIPAEILLAYSPTDTEAQEYAIELFRRGKDARAAWLAKLSSKRASTSTHAGTPGTRGDLCASVN